MKRAKQLTVRRIALGLAVAAIAPATAQANPIDMTGEDFRYVHSQRLADAKKRVDAADLRKAAAQQRSRPPRMYDGRIIPG